MKESPAPTVSATVVGGTGASAVPVRVNPVEPAPPRVTSTVAGPRASQRAATDGTGSPG